MNTNTIKTAEAEAKRFLAAVAKVKSLGVESSLYSYPKETGAMRRASMDLTRALSEMRRPS
jgi:hypothetical protein